MSLSVPRPAFGRAASPSDPPPVAPSFRPRLLCAVWGPKGGVGKSTVAANLAAAIARTGRPVLALDLDLRAPALGVHFGLASPGGLATLLGEAVTTDTVRHHARPAPGAPGVHVLTASPSDLLSLGAEEADRLIAACLDAWDVVVADCASPIDEATTFAALRAATLVYLVVDQDRVAVETAWEALRLAADAGIPRDRVRLVVNRYLPGYGIPVSAIEQYLGLRARAVIPAQPLAYLRAVQEGKPCGLSLNGKPDNPWARLAADALGTEAPAAPRHGFLTRLFRRRTREVVGRG
ncbi:AAA family ATPase [Caldinitratiruptor microaerophilus]|uniref:CobQ/CobB/MinD/ParA nucleotide binding domain-containing protein n=1 Tax=Caldinitratiruptor microaerophilus TaxID=671077 RepID=A0AA35G7E4_9FIRM|nr:AAA family ATPase [Caldinitratiruptor microaerophilus]BDG59765.1 hypothetical protein caldi_08550 [Caldinitratiruptor microaerophilus]